MNPTFGERARSPAHRSFWRSALARRAQALPLEDWLIAQANLRGFHGAFVADVPVSVDPYLRLEEIVVGLLAPQAEADPRVLKLVLRILQSGRVDPARLSRLARMERADGVLHWLCANVPEGERNAPFQAAAAFFVTPPRGWRSLEMRYDFGRLRRRPFRLAEAAWSRSGAS